MNKSETITELAKALAKAHSELSNPKKNSINPFFKSQYADLAEVINVSKNILAENGLSIIQMPSFNEGIVSVEGLLMHTSGEFISSVMTIPISKNDAQGVGASITYARRYQYAAMISLAQEDLDAEPAVRTQNEIKEENEQLREWTAEMINLIEKEDPAIVELWDNIERHFQESIWKILSSKQKTEAKALLYQSRNADKEQNNENNE